MYRRIEKIEDENLDWDEQNMRLTEVIGEEQENIIFSPTFKSKKKLWQSITEFEIEKKWMNFFERNMEFSSFIVILLLPYLLGFLLAYVLFYNYTSMTIMDFVSIEKDHLLFQLWSIGAYLFVTLWLMWAFSKIVQNVKQILHLRA